MLLPSLGYVSMPDHFTRILCSNMQKGEDNFDNLAEYIRSDQGFYALVQRSFRDVDEKVRVEVIIKSIGWYGFRNRLAALFLEYQLNGRFPYTANLELCHELIALEDSVKNQTVEGFSRAFMLGFYWKLYRYRESNDFIDSFNWKDVLNLFKQTKARVVKIDWLLFMIMHFYTFLGKEVLREALKGTADYNDLYNRLDESQKKIYLKNALSYGASINESEFFYQSRI